MEIDNQQQLTPASADAEGSRLEPFVSCMEQTKWRIKIMGDLVIMILSLVIAFGLLIGGCLLAENTWENYKCNNYAEVTGKETRWIALDVCYVKNNDKWQRWDEYKATIVAKEGLSYSN